MSQTITFYPLGNAETCLFELNDGNYLLFDYAQMNDGTPNDNRYDIKADLEKIKRFRVVMFSHAHEDHVKGASSFFYLDHAKKYQSDDRAKIDELWVSAAFILDTNLDNESDAKILRNEARYRLKEGYGVRVFAEPNELDSWLDEQGIDKEDVQGLFIHAGETITLESVSDSIEFFVHAPFADDTEEIQNKNDPSIVIQIRIQNGDTTTNILITGDTPYQVLDKIVDVSKIQGNEDRLDWDIYDIPHHCSYTGLNEKTNENKIEPTENVRWMLDRASIGAYMVASCDKITEKTSPPHLIAKHAYEKNTDKSISFIATMEHIPDGEVKPTPVVFTIDNMGLTFKRSEKKQVYFNKPAPRAGR